MQGQQGRGHFLQKQQSADQGTPCTGEDNHYILKEFLNFDENKIEELKKDDIVQICTCEFF